MKLLVINGPNLNMLGIRERSIYGSKSYGELISLIEETCRDSQIEVECYQSNHEGELVDKIQSAYQKADGIVINGGAYSHTSIALLDAIKAVGIPAVEVHITNVFEREQFRHRSYIGMACEKSYIGLGFDGYVQGIMYLKEKYGD